MVLRHLREASVFLCKLVYSLISYAGKTEKLIGATLTPGLVVLYLVMWCIYYLITSYQRVGHNLFFAYSVTLSLYY